MLTPEQRAATAATIRAVQRPDGAIPWFDGGHVDPWNHVEAAMGLAAAGQHDAAEAAYRWLLDNQRTDGSFAARYVDGVADTTDVDGNFCAYLAVGVLHHAHHDRGFAATAWPGVERALDFVLGMRRPDGCVRWLAEGDDLALVTGNASILLSLRAASTMAGARRPDWDTAAAELAAVLRAGHGFAPKPHAMDWYYPVLCGAHAEDRLDARWREFVEPGFGVRCVRHEPWVTGGETAELVITLAALGRTAAAEELFGALHRLRHDDGSYWTGYQLVDREFWPVERTTWTAGAVLLADAVLRGDPATLAVFSRPRPGPVPHALPCARSTGR